MAELKVSELPKASYTKPSDKLMIIQNGSNKYIEFSDLLNSLKSNSSIIFGGKAKAASATKPAEDAGETHVSDIIFRSSNDTDLLFLSTLNDGAVSINGRLTDPAAKFQIFGNVKIENLYLDSYETLRPASATEILSLSVGVETSKLIAYNSSTKSTFKLGSGISGQTKYIVYMGSIVPGTIVGPQHTGTDPIAEVDIDTIALSDHETGNPQTIFNKMKFKRRGAGVTLKFVKEPSHISGFWSCVGSYEVDFS